MTKPVALVTGACGEMGHLLVPALAARGYDVVALDLAPLDPAIAAACSVVVQASILDTERVGAIFRDRHPALVFHLAAVLSTKAERDPDLANDVNLLGTVALLRMARQTAGHLGKSVRFLFPSSMAVYGFPDRATKDRAGAVREDQWDRPTGLYGIHKRQCEMLGSYLAARAQKDGTPGLDFRAIRFPGLISPETVPSGGTSDYAPEMLHAAAQGRPYACFVAPESRVPFMTMGEGVEAFLTLAHADPAALTTRVYNIRSWSASAAAIRDAVVARYPGARISFEPNPARQAIIDAWPADQDDSAARADWGFAPRCDLDAALDQVLVPALTRRYPAGAAR